MPELPANVKPSSFGVVGAALRHPCDGRVDARELLRDRSAEEQVKPVKWLPTLNLVGLPFSVAEG